MLKKILSLILCLCICFGVVFSATSCGSSEGNKNTSNSTAKVPTRLSFLGITSEETDPANVKMVEEALNEIFAARFKTKIDLTLVTEDQYMDLVKERIEIAKEYEVYDTAIAQYNAYIKKQANKTTTTDKIFGNWISGGVKVTLETLATRLIYVSEQTTVLEDGRVETLYPEAPSPVDIVMIVDEDMYDEFNSMGLLMGENINPSLTSYKNLQKYIYPTFFTELVNLKGKVNAIPNNNMLAESTYLVVKKDLAEKYNFDIDTFKDYRDLSAFLAEVKENEEIVPFKEAPEALGIFQLFSDDVAIGAYLDPMIGYNPEEGKDKIEIKNLFEIKEYTDHLELMEAYHKAGYFSRDEFSGKGFAVEVMKGDASIAARYDNEESEYLVKEIQIPFVLREAVFNGMLAPTAYTSDLERSMEIIEAINTDADVKNLLQYGIEGYNYIPNELTGSIIQLNGTYIMDNALTGNVYVGYVPYEPDEEKLTAWSYVMQTNLAAAASPFLLFPVDEAYLQENLEGILKRAGLSEALEAVGVAYKDYANPKSASMGAQYQNMLRNFNDYKSYYVAQAIEQGKVDATASDAQARAEAFVKTAPISWIEETIALKFINDNYSKIATIEQIETLVGEKLAGVVLGSTNTATYENARKLAAEYIANIKSLRVIAKETLFADMTDAEYEATYGSLGILDFEKAVYDHLKLNYEKDNNLTPSDYEKLVQDFIAECFKFTDPKTKQQYTYSWEEFVDIKEKASEFSAALQIAKTEYSKLIRDLGGAKPEQIDAWDDITLTENILSTLRREYYNNMNTGANEFATWIYDNIILAPFSVTKSELDILKVKDNALYKDILAKVKKTFKSQLLESYTKDDYNTMTDTAALTAVLDYYIESYTQAYTKLCNTMGYSRDEFDENFEYCQKYVECVNKKMKTTFTYTLQTRYNKAEIDAMTVAQLEKAVYDIVYESGYYMNELAKCIGIDLSEYNFAKSDAIAYLGDAQALASKPGYLMDTIRYYQNDLAKKGYTIDQARALEPEEAEALIREIIREKDFADYNTLDVVIGEFSGIYVDVAGNYAIAETELEEVAKSMGLKLEEFYAIYGRDFDVKKFSSFAKTYLSNDYLFNAVVGYLNDALQAELNKE